MSAPLRNLLSLFAAIPLVAGSAFGWGCEGHQIIALIARAHLTPAASAAVDQLLRDNPIDPSIRRFCENRPADLMADSATWADDTRRAEKTGAWHYTDIPITAHGGDSKRWCEPIGPSIDGKDRPGCVINAIELEWNVLKDPAQTSPAGAMALRYLIHLIGDLSQPLHVGENHDQGGNCTRMNFFFQERPENLHAIWDSNILHQDLTKQEATQVQYAAMLDQRFSKHWHEWGESKPDVNAWVWQSQKRSAKVAYGKLKPPIPIASKTDEPADPAACDAGRALVESLHITINDGYVDQALPVIREQLARAGYHLAGLLNQTFLR